MGEKTGLKTWERLADQLDEIREGYEEYVDEYGKTKRRKKPAHEVEAEYFNLCSGRWITGVVSFWMPILFTS